MSILKDYVHFHNHYTQHYENETTNIKNHVVVFMEVGSFFELYAYPDKSDESKYTGCDIYVVCDLLNIQVTKRNKNICAINEDNYLMAGFPSHSVKKFVDILVNNMYTVVLVEQVTPTPNVTRKVTHIYSPSTYIDNIKSYNTNNMMVLYFEKIKHKTMDIFVVGWSVFDASTGISHTNEITSLTDMKLLMDEVYRLVILHDPKELVLISTNDNMDSDYVYDYLNDNRYIINRLNKMEDMYTKLKFQNKILRTVFPDVGMLSPIEYIHMEFKPFALISYVYMIQFTYEHNENFLLQINKPIIYKDESDNKSLVLEYNAVTQLNIIGGNISIESIFNNCCTSIGKRYFKNKLLSPTSDAIVLQNSYDMIELFKNNKTWNIIHKDMSNIKDIERLLRKAIMSKLQPCQFVLIYDSMISLKNVIQNLAQNKEINYLFIQKNTFPLSKIAEFEHYCQDKVCIEEMSRYNIDNIKTNMFSPTYNTDLNDIYKSIDTILESYKKKQTKIDETWMKLDYNEKDSYFYSITSKRWESVKAKFRGYNVISSTGNSVKVQSPNMKENNKDLKILESEAKSRSVEVYDSFIKEMISCFYELLFRPCISFIETLDFYTTNAKNAVDYILSKPTINEGTKSYFNFDEVRHPLVEYVQKNVMYTSNSLELGSDDKPTGLVLYGVNAAGKSSFMKSIGVNIIMAQAGMYTACKSMEYVPYKHLFTRIVSSDNILKGMSTFANEIYEIRNILKKKDENSIVIGDELCSGTESTSAIAIIMAGIQTLTASKTTFIFATHLHELTKLKDMKLMIDDNKIYIKHLQVKYDDQTDTLIYDRKLTDGPGSAIYGLEVCKAMDMGNEFLHNAYRIRSELLDLSEQVVSDKTSRYNKKVITDKCGICKKNKDVETHHIRFQKDADEQGIIDNTFHKNAQFNLIPLCSVCHQKVHKETLLIHGYHQTSNGVQLMFEMNHK